MTSLKLGKPIDINGEKVNELTYDFEEMTARDKNNASKLYMKTEQQAVMVQELDPVYHMYLFAAAVKKANSSIEVEDVLRISALDSSKAEALARDFFFGNSEE